MTKGVKELILDYDDFFQAFEKYQLQQIGLMNLGNPSRNKDEDILKKARTCKLLKDGEFTLLDGRIEAEKETVDRFIKRMQEDWDVKKGAQLKKEMQTRREELINKMVMILQEKCAVIGCKCIEWERDANLIIPGSGTMQRYANARSKAEKILAGTEPWNEFRNEMGESVENMFQFKDNLDELERAMANVGLD